MTHNFQNRNINGKICERLLTAPIFSDLPIALISLLVTFTLSAVRRPSREELEPSIPSLLAEWGKNGLLLVHTSGFLCLHHHCPDLRYCLYMFVFLSPNRVYVGCLLAKGYW